MPFENFDHSPFNNFPSNGLTVEKNKVLDELVRSL